MNPGHRRALQSAIGMHTRQLWILRLGAVALLGVGVAELVADPFEPVDLPVVKQVVLAVLVAIGALLMVAAYQWSLAERRNARAELDEAPLP